MSTRKREEGGRPWLFRPHGRHIPLHLHDSFLSGQGLGDHHFLSLLVRLLHQPCLAHVSELTEQSQRMSKRRITLMEEEAYGMTGIKEVEQQAVEELSIRQ